MNPGGREAALPVRPFPRWCGRGSSPPRAWGRLTTLLLMPRFFATSRSKGQRHGQVTVAGGNASKQTERRRREHPGRMARRRWLRGVQVLLGDDHDPGSRQTLGLGAAADVVGIVSELT